MTTTRGSLIEVGERLPALTLPDAASGADVRWRWAPSGTSVVVFPHDDECGDCRAWLEDLAEARDKLANWDARPLVVMPAGQAARRLGEQLDATVVADESDEARQACGVPQDDAAVFVADRFGDVFETFAVGEGHAFPPVEDLVEWAKYLGTQCPECGVPDDPGLGEWEPLDDADS